MSMTLDTPQVTAHKEVAQVQHHLRSATDSMLFYMTRLPGRNPLEDIGEVRKMLSLLQDYDKLQSTIFNKAVKRWRTRQIADKIAAQCA